MRFLYLLLIISFVSCADNTIDLYFPANFVNENEVIINKDIYIKVDSLDASYAFISVKPGKINVSVNGEEQEITTRKGGILNLNKENFVMFPIVFGDQNEFYNKINILPYSLVVDSLLYYKETGKFDENFYRTQFMKNGTSGTPEQFSESDAYLSLIKRDDFFTEKNWDVDLIEDIPEEMQVYGNDKSSSLRVVRNSNFFYLYSLMSEEYKVIDFTEKPSEIEEVPME